MDELCITIKETLSLCKKYKQRKAGNPTFRVVLTTHSESPRLSEFTDSQSLSDLR